MDCRQFPGLEANLLDRGHPCFSLHRHGQTGRIHLPVAPECNISCNYCVRKFDCANESRPGVTSQVIGPEEAVDRVRHALQSSLGSKLKVAGIAGPGEPLANKNTFETMASLKSNFPGLILCLSTNGLLLPENLPTLIELGISHITVTINTLDPDIAARIYSYVHWKGQVLIGRPAASLLVERQLTGIEMASRAGLTVKVNTVVMPGLNDHNLTDLSLAVQRLGTHIQNLMPLIPQGKFADRPTPARGEIGTYRERLSRILPQMSHCQQCRADAVGLV